MSPYVVAACGVAALLLAWPRAASAPPSPAPAPRRRLPRPSATFSALVLAAGAALLLGGPTGIVTGVALGIGVRLVVPRLESRRDRDRRERLSRQAPLTVDLVAACLASGSGLEVSLSAAARAVGAPTSEVLHSAVAALRLGADPQQVWADLAAEPGLGALARAVSRSQQTGAPLAQLLPRVAAEVRATERARVDARIRTAAVRLTAPLGAALLPAFFLLGVVPVVASWVDALL